MTDLADPQHAAGERPRAKRMAPEERRAMIATQAVPLFLEHGAALTTRQLAEHLGIAEGTLFRAFGDKESLVRAAVEAFFEQARQRTGERLVEADQTLEEKVRALVRGMRRWMEDMFRMLALLDRADLPAFRRPDRDRTYQSAMTAVFTPHAGELRVPPEKMGAIMRIAAIAANAARVDAGAGLSEDDIVQFILYGVAAVSQGKD